MISENLKSNDPLKQQFIGHSECILKYFDEEGITDVLINGTHSLYIEKKGELISYPPLYSDARKLFELMERMLIPVGKRLDASAPFLDGKLLDGSRFHIIAPPIATYGPYISIRIHRKRQESLLDDFGDKKVIEYVKEQVKKKRNLIICGATGSGKTTLLMRLLESVSLAERIAVIEESSEIFLNHPHVVFLEARTQSPEGIGEVTLRTLVRNALRMRPDRIVVGESRGEEAFDMLLAMNSGHSGSLTTLHANSALEGLKKLESLVLLAGRSLSLEVVRQWISSCIHGVVYLKKDEARRVIFEVIKIEGLEGDRYRYLPIL